MKPRYRCPECGKYLTLRKDGTIRAHLRPFTFGGSTDCEGAGEPPGEPLIPPRSP
jgi:hypothetical protein